MKNNKKTITPSEINKFLYCPYQWYYERYYGRTVLRELNKKRNEKYKLEDTIKSNFNKGFSFHDTYLYKEKLKVRLTVFAIIILIVLWFIISKG